MDENGNNVDFLRFPLAKNSLSSCLYDSPIRFLSPQSRVFCQITVDAVIVIRKFLNNFLSRLKAIVIFRPRVLHKRVNSTITHT